jgi:hypothetical protein
MDFFSVYFQSSYLQVEILQVYSLLDTFNEISSLQTLSSLHGPFQFRLKDSTSALLQIRSIEGLFMTLFLDIQSHILCFTQNEQVVRERLYIFTRFNERYQIRIGLFNEEKEMIEIDQDEIENEFATFDFFLQQFCRYYSYLTPRDQTVIDEKVPEKSKANIVARGAESTGFLLRKGVYKIYKILFHFIRFKRRR